MQTCSCTHAIHFLHTPTPHSLMRYHLTMILASWFKLPQLPQQEVVYSITQPSSTGDSFLLISILRQGPLQCRPFQAPLGKLTMKFFRSLSNFERTQFSQLYNKMGQTQQFNDESCKYWTLIPLETSDRAILREEKSFS